MAAPHRTRRPARRSHARPSFGRFPALLALALGCSDSGGPANTPPEAVVRPVSGAVRGDTVVLDGTSSHDAEGDSLRFAWTIVSKPSGSVAELVPADEVSPAFVADVVGAYQVSLVVSDGRASSSPEGTAIIVTIPAPSVTIASPADETIVTASPVIVTGSVTDAVAVTVNGVAATVVLPEGTFSVSVPLDPGSNAITASATNPIGSGSDEVGVILNTAGVPVVKIGSPRTNFLVGDTYLGNETPQSETVPVRGVIRVYTTEAANMPTVTVNGVAATIGDTSYTGCPTGLPKRCFKFNATLTLGRGTHAIKAVGRDVLNGRDSASVTGASDHAFRPTNQQWTDANRTVNPIPWTSYPDDRSILQPPGTSKIQNNRAQEIDGCSAPTGETRRNDPMGDATENRAPTAFGSGTEPPSEYLVFGQRSADALPCNKHDICYQTVGSSRSTCDDVFLEDMRAVCNKAYPLQTSSYLLLHPKYKAEQSKCYNKATLYYDAVRVAGLARFNKRQEEHTYTPTIVFPAPPPIH